MNEPVVALSAVPSAPPAKPRSAGGRSSREIGIGPGASTRSTAARYSAADAADATSAEAANAHPLRVHSEPPWPHSGTAARGPQSAFCY